MKPTVMDLIDRYPDDETAFIGLLMVKLNGLSPVQYRIQTVGAA